MDAPSQNRPSAQGGPAARLADVSLSFGGKDILRSFSLDLPIGHKVALLGESSCGKTSLLKVMVGLIAPDRGQALLFGQDLARMGRKEREAARRRVGMQFQAGALFDSMSVYENLLLASREAGQGRERKAAGPERIMGLLSQVGLAKAAGRNPASLSGGMRKRAALARALISDPDLAIFDEPTAGLDPLTGARIIRLIGSLSETGRMAMILATSDADVARRFSSDVILMAEGRVKARGSLEELRASQDPYLLRFFSRLSKAEAHAGSPPGRQPESLPGQEGQEGQSQGLAGGSLEKTH
jgi:phospholipid/cholesterol/gamma-HCH transport system ATP-binding protein